MNGQMSFETFILTGLLLVYTFLYSKYTRKALFSCGILGFQADFLTVYGCGSSKHMHKTPLFYFELMLPPSFFFHSLPVSHI